MKTLILSSIIAISFALLPTKANACVNPDTVVIIVVNYDTIWAIPCPFAKEMEIRISNLRLMNENPNQICACALASFSDIFTNLQYIAFVDSGTNMPYQGFAKVNALLASSTAWDTAQPGYGGWDGYVISVINSGLSSSDPVEMVIRLTAPAGNSITFDTLCTNVMLSKLAQSSLGTDAWNDTTMALRATHQSVRSLDALAVSGSQVTFNEVTPAYFTQLDSDILNNLNTGMVFIPHKPIVKVYPNPVTDRFTVEFNLNDNQVVEIEFLDMVGRSYGILLSSNLATGSHTIPVSLTNRPISGGIHFLRIIIGDQIIYKKIILLRE